MWENAYLEHQKPKSFQGPQAGPGPWLQFARFNRMTPLCYVGKFRPQNLGPPLDQILDPHLCIQDIAPLLHFAVADLGGHPRNVPSPMGQNFLKLMWFFGNFCQNHMLAPPPRGLAPPPTGNPGSAPALDYGLADASGGTKHSHLPWSNFIHFHAVLPTKLSKS